MNGQAWDSWRAAVATPAIDQAIGDLYAQLDAAVQQRGPTCWTSGKCCHFDAYGHRLYVTGLEIAWVLARIDKQISRDETGGDRHSLPLPQLAVSTSQPLMPSCPYQRDKLCTIHRVRPMGCRVFFCQAGTQDWQRELYESFLGKLRALHETHRQAYRYMEWRAGLREAIQARG